VSIRSTTLQLGAGPKPAPEELLVILRLPGRRFAIGLRNSHDKSTGCLTVGDTLRPAPIFVTLSQVCILREMYGSTLLLFP
jgi:hypothetical protein